MTISGCLLNRFDDSYVNPSTMTTLLRYHLLALSAAAASGIAHAAPGTESLVTLRTVEQYTVPGTVLRDAAGRPVRPTVPAYENEWTRENAQGNPVQTNYEYRSNVVSARLSNREFLGFLVSEGVIPSISGWSLKAIYNESEQLPEYYITRSGAAPIYVGGYFDVAAYGEASQVRASSIERYNSSGDVVSSSARDTSTTKTELALTFSTRDLSAPNEQEGSTMSFGAMWRHTLALRQVYRGEYRYINGPGTIYSISGTIDDVVSNGSGGFDYYQSIIEGSWVFSPGRPIDNLSPLFPEAEPPAPTLSGSGSVAAGTGTGTTVPVVVGPGGAVTTDPAE